MMANSNSPWIENPEGEVSSVFGRPGTVVAQTGDYSVSQITGAAPLASPNFTGTPTVPTAPFGTNSTQAASTAFVAASGVSIRPEIYGPSNGDWGPAITAAWAEAYALGTYVQLSASTYGITTTIQPPTVAAGRALPPIVGISGVSNTRLLKEADVTLLNCSGTGLGSYYQGSLLEGIMFDGGNNSGWTQPLLTFNWIVDHESRWLWFQNNYGAAFTVRGSWDCRWNHVTTNGCGATDGVNPSILLYSNSGDGGSSTNNQWFQQLRCENFRTGALWAVGATSSDSVALIKLDETKIEQTGGTSWGPAFQLTNVGGWMADKTQITTAGAPAAGQSTPFDAYYIVNNGCSHISLGNIYGYFGGVGSGNCRSLFALLGHNYAFSYGNVDLNFTDANTPTSVFYWGSSPISYALVRGNVATATGTQPTLDSGSTFLGSTEDFDTFRQQSTTGTTGGFTAGSGTAMNSASTSTGNTGTGAYTFGDVIAALKAVGLLKS